MSLDASLPVLLAQMGHVQEIAHKESAHPEAQQAAAKQTIAETLKHEQDAVEKPDKAEHSKLLLDKDGKGGTGGHGKGRRRRRPPPGEPEEEDTAQAAKSPWQGNILNVKV